MDDTVTMKQEKRQNQSCLMSGKRQSVNTDFLFQDEKKIRISVAFIRKYPTSVFFLICEAPDSYHECDNAYYVDFPSLSVDKLIQYMQNDVSLDSLSMNEIVDIYDALGLFFHDYSTEYQIKIETFLVDEFKKFNTTNKCELVLHNKNSNYDYLYDHDKEHELFVNDLFSEDIPYEYIYPSNIHVMFSKLEKYIIQPSYYSLNKYIKVTRTDVHYNELYEDYKLVYNKYPHSLVSNENISRYSERHDSLLNKDQIRLYPSNNEWNDKDNENNNNNKDIHVSKDIDEEVQNEKEEEEKPDLYIQSLVDYSREYNTKQIEKEENDKNNLKSCCSLKISYVDNTGKKPNPLLQLDIPVTICYLKEGIFNNLQVITFQDFICSNSYPEYIQLFKSIITTHVFPNITTLNYYGVLNDYNDILLENELLCLITRNNFPQLHIYDLRSYMEYTNQDRLNQQLHLLLPLSFLQLIDTLYLIDCNTYRNGDYLTDKALEQLIEVKKMNSNHCTIYFNQPLIQYNVLLKELHNLNIISINELSIITNRLSNDSFDYTIFDLSLCPIKYLDLNMYYLSENKVQILEKIYKNINVKSLKTIFGPGTEDSYMNFVQKCVSLFCSSSYDSVTYLNEDSHSFGYITRRKYKIPFDVTWHLVDCMYLLKEQKELPIWKIVTELTVAFNIVIDLDQVLKFVDLFKNISYTNISNLNTFSIFYLDGFVEGRYRGIYNLFESFPSLAYYCHKRIDTISMCNEFTDTLEYPTPAVYYDYIHNQLNMEYSVNIQKLYIIVEDIEFFQNIADIIIKNQFPYLRHLILYIDEEYLDEEELDLIIISLETYKNETNPSLFIGRCSIDDLE
ncbi:hypothetical protein WA158_002809 [Blastocystis sp. Blastoise]